MAITAVKFLAPVIGLAVFTLLSGLALHFVEKAAEPDQRCSAGKSFMNGVDLAASIVTAIGYGHIIPCTPAGKVVTSLVTIVGLPLTLFVLDQVGKVLVFLVRKSWRLLSRPCQRKKGKDGEVITVDSALPLWVGLATAIIWILISSTYFSLLEEWPFMQAVYFTFISVTTVGLSPYTMKMVRNTIYNYYFLFIGLAVVSMCINVVKDKITEKFTKARSELESLQNKVMSGEHHPLDPEEAAKLAMKSQGAYQFLFSDLQKSVIREDADKMVGTVAVGTQANLISDKNVKYAVPLRHVSQQISRPCGYANEPFAPPSFKKETVIIMKYDDGTVVSKEKEVPIESKDEWLAMEDVDS